MPVNQSRNIAFPLKVAAIDIGSNAIRFQAAEFFSPVKYAVIDSQRASVRLGHNSFLKGELDKAAMDEAVAAVTSFKDRMSGLGITHYRAVATSAVRESSNGPAFLRRAERAAGLKIEMINGTEEARLVYVAVKRKLPLQKRRWIIANLGGGSLELSLVRNSSVAWSQTYRIGAVRLFEELTEDGIEPKGYKELLREYVSTLKVDSSRLPSGDCGFIASGGNIEEIARVAGASLDANGVSVISTARLRAAINMLSSMSYEKRISKLGLRKDRADVILPAAVVYERLAAIAGSRSIIVPYTGTREGILLDLVDKLTTASVHEARRSKELAASAIQIGQHYRFDRLHSSHVTDLSLSLFDQLADLHELGPSDRCVLLAAAMLHDIGAYISYKGHHKHSQYLIAQSELPGLNEREVLMASNVARYHRKAEPCPAHEYFAVLTQDERARVAKLASILRMADALDRDHARNIKSIAAIVERPYLTLVPEARRDIALEKWALRKKDKLFNKIFGLKVRVKANGKG